MGVTSHDVARLAGVSQATVSRALRGDPRVSAETVSKVRKAAEALDYVPSEAGRSLSTRSTRRIGLLVTDVANPFYPHLIAPLHDELSGLGHRLMLFTESSDAATAAEQLLDRSVDGVVLATSTLDSRFPGELRRHGLPFVYLNRESAPAADSVMVDNRLGGELAANELIRLGHRGIAGIFGPGDTSTGRDREMGFRLTVAEAGIALPNTYVRHGPFEFDTGFEGLRELLAMDPAPTAVFCGNDVVAIGALNAAIRAGVTVPDELTVLGFDDLPMASWAAFELSTIHYDLQEMARTAARMIVERAHGTDEPFRRTVLPPEFVPRRTHGAPPVS